MRLLTIIVFAILFLNCFSSGGLRKTQVIVDNSGDTVTVPKLVKKIIPLYPQDMVKHKVEGVVKIKALIGIDGKVLETKVVEDIGYSSGKVVSKAVKRFVFKPAKKNGKKTAAWVLLQIRFKLT